MRIYIERYFPRTIVEASLEYSFRNLRVKLLNEETPKPRNCWKDLLEVEGFFPTINSGKPVDLEASGYEYLLVGGFMEGGVEELKLEDNSLKDFKMLSKRYALGNSPSSSILKLIDNIKPVTYTYSGVGVYLVVDRWKAKKAALELLKVFDPEEVVVIGLDKYCNRVYKSLS